MPQTAIQQVTEQAANNQLNLSHLLTALGFSVTVIFTLLGVIWSANKKTQEAQSDRLDDGEEEFTKTKVELANLKKDVASIRQWLIVAENKIKDLETSALNHHDALNAIKIYHKKQHGEEIN
jgi:hypothetical protein